MAFLSLLKSNSCFKTCIDESFNNRLSDSHEMKEYKIKFIQSYNEQKIEIRNFSTYEDIVIKFKKLIETHKINEKISLNIDHLLSNECFNNRTKITNDSSKTDLKQKQKKNLNKEKVEIEKLDRKSRKRSAKVAEISVIYEENESIEKTNSNTDKDLKIANQVKKIIKEKQAKMMQKQNMIDLESDQSVLISNEKKSKKSRLSCDEESKAKKSTKKKTRNSNKIKKAKKKSLSNLSSNTQKETISFIENIEKLDNEKKADIKSQSINLEPNVNKTSFKFTMKTTPSSNLTKFQTTKPIGQFNSIKKNNQQTTFQVKKDLSQQQTPYKAQNSYLNKKQSNDIKPGKAIVKDLIEKFEEPITKFKKFAFKCKNFALNQKQFSIIRRSLGKAKLSITKKEIKRKSTKHVGLIKDLVKEMNKTTGQISTNNSLLNSSVQSQKLIVNNVTTSIKKKQYVINHKSNSIVKTNLAKLNNNIPSKTPLKTPLKTANISKTNSQNINNKINKMADNPVKKINLEDLKYSEAKYKEAMEARKKKLEEKFIRSGSTSTISTVSSLNYSSLSNNSFKYDAQSFKTVNSTFDSIKMEKIIENVEKVKKVNTTNTTQIVRDKNITYNIKEIQHSVNTVNKQILSNKTQIINNSHKPRIETPKKGKNDLAFKTPNKPAYKIANGTIIINATSTKTSNSTFRSSSANVTFCKDTKIAENYGIDTLKSDDETDDEEAPTKPIPEWAKDANILKRSQIQAKSFINFTKMFKSATNEEVNLEKIFKISKKTFYHRSSSADWKSPPIWRTNGLTGNESFKQASH